MGLDANSCLPSSPLYDCRSKRRRITTVEHPGEALPAFHRNQLRMYCLSNTSLSTASVDDAENFSRPMSVVYQGNSNKRRLSPMEFGRAKAL